MSNVTASASRTTTASPAGAAGSPARDHADARFEPQRAGHGTAVGGGASAIAVDAAHDEIAVRGRFDGRALRRLHPRLERDLSRTAGGQPHDDDLVGRAREHLARERHAAAGEGHVGRCRRQIEIASVVLDRIDLWKRQREIADRLVRHLRERLRHHLRVDELRRLGVLALGEQAPDFGQRVFRVRIHRIVRPARPQRVLVQLQPLVDDAAEHHRAEPAVANWKGANPLGGAGLATLPRRIQRQQRMIGGRRAIPEAERRRGRRRFAGQPRRGWRLRRRDDDARGERATETGACERPAQPAPGAHLPLFRTSTTASNAGLGWRWRSQSSG